MEVKCNFASAKRTQNYGITSFLVSESVTAYAVSDRLVRGGLYWGLDSCASQHITNQFECTDGLTGRRANIMCADGETLENEKIYNMKEMINNETESIVDMKTAIYSSGIAVNILALSKLNEQGYTTSPDFSKLFLPHSSTRFIPIELIDGIYMVKLEVYNSTYECLLVSEF